MFATIAKQIAADKSDAARADLGSIVAIGAPGSSDPQSGTIMKILSGIDGFMTRVTDGAKNGHSYRVIHIPGKSEFILEDSFNGTNGKKETRRQIFKITPETKSGESDAPRASDDWARFKPNYEPKFDDPMSLLDQVEAGLDEIITSMKV